MLVTSYLPVISLIARSCVLCGLLDVFFGLQLPRHALLGVACAAVFWDYYAHRSVRVSVLCGGLAAPTLAAFATRWWVAQGNPDSMPWPPVLAPTCNSTQIFVMACISDMSLGVACSFHLCCLAFQPALALPRAPILWTALTLGKLWLLCDSVTLLELLCRVVLYYVACMLVLYATPYLPNLDRVKHRVVTPHLCIHFLFVHFYVAMGSVVVFSVVLSKVYLKSSPGPAPATPSSIVIAVDTCGSATSTQTSATSRSSTSSSAGVDPSLLEQLRRAKAQKTHSVTETHI